MAGYIGGKVAVSAPQQIETKHTITATASQTSIPNISYTVGAVHVYQNGIRLVDGTDYTATNGSTVTLETGATEGDQIVIVSHGSFETSDTVSKASGGTFSSNVTVSGNVTATGSVTANSLIVPDGSIPLVDLDIDGGTDIGAALVDADLMIVDDGAGGTNRKATMSRLATYMGTKIGGGLEFIASLDANNSGTLSFTGFDTSKYDAYRFVFSNIIPVNDNVSFDARTSSNDGSSYDSGSTDYKMARFKGGSYLAYSASGYGAGVDIGSAAGEDGCSGELLVFGPHLDTKKTYLTSRSVQINNTGATLSLYNTGYRDSAAEVNAIQFLAGSGNLESGTITMYGMVNS